MLRSLGAQVGSLAVPEAAEAMAEQKRVLVVGAEACVVNARLLDEHFDELDPVVAHRMVGGRQLSAPDYFALHRQWAELRRGRAPAWPTWTRSWCRPLPSPRSPWPRSTTRGAYAQHNGRYLRNTAVGNILGLCGVSVPCGFTRAGLPIGLMVYAKPFQEDVALRVARAYERATEWHRRQPDLAWAAAGTHR